MNHTRQAQIAALVATDLAAREIRAAIRALEIPYGSPRRIRTIRAIPVLPNGKLDREQVQRLLISHRGLRTVESLTDTG